MDTKMCGHKFEKEDLQSQSISPKLLINCKKNSNFVMEKPSRHQSIQMIKVNITNNKTCQNHESLDKMHREKLSVW